MTCRGDANDTSAAVLGFEAVFGQCLQSVFSVEMGVLPSPQKAEVYRAQNTNLKELVLSSGLCSLLLTGREKTKAGEGALRLRGGG